MRVLIAYDVNTEDRHGRRRLRKIAKACEGSGSRVQFSLFECGINQTQWATLRLRLLDLIDAEKDSLRFYFLDEDTFQRTEHHGTRKPRDLEEPLII